MAANLLERDQFLFALDELLHQVAAGRGRIALISGEAGIGKTSLVECFLERSQPATRTLWGTCEALFTPRPLGPLYDIAQQTQTPLRALLDGEANRATLFAAVLDDLTHGPAPTIVVIEDIHWADEATLDLMKYLARRIHRTTALLIMTYRDDELRKDHPLRLVLGDLPADNNTRLWLPALSEVAVTALAKQGKGSHSAKQLYAVTGGNPFFITQVLASGALGVPTSVSDAVLARVARLSPQACRLLNLVAVVPNRIELEIIEAVGGSAGDSAALEECLAANMVQLGNGAVGFRHELARQAVEGALSSARRRVLHAEILHALLERGVERIPLAQLVHHAAQAEDSALVLRFAPTAARQASAQGAHREAAAHYRTALRYADCLAAEQRAKLLDGLANEHYLTGQMEDAIVPYEVALALWRALGHREQVGHTLRRLSRLHWFLGRNAEAKRYAMEAVEALEPLPPSRELAMAYGNLSHLGTRANDSADTLFWGERAIALAERLDDLETVVYVLNSMGLAELANGDERGRTKLERSLELALEHRYEEHVARAYANLAIYNVACRAYAQAEGYLRDGIAYCAERDLGPWGHFLRWVQARARFDQGDWVRAEEGATAILSVPWMSVTNRIPALLVLGQVRARRGDPGAEALLDEVRDLAMATGDMQRIEPMAAARAEWRWLQGDRAGCAAEAAVGLPLALHASRPWYQGEVAIWLWRGGGLNEAPPWTPAPYALELAGDWRAAAAAWEQLGCPYEQALALMEGDEPAQREALAIFERMGAAPAAAIVRHQLRAAGVRGLPRGPRLATQANPQGLTPRQLEVLLLLAEGLHNSEIADRLSTTPKTVEHHVSAVLAKLEVRSRAEAVRRAYQLGLVPHSPQTPHMATPPTRNMGG
jgi:DNA-binding CsgD family transcriptional regulator